MKICETCGNEYDKVFQVVISGETHTFDCFECALQTLAPRCRHCKTRIVGHGVEVDSVLFCSAHCARADGKTGAYDRSPEIRHYWRRA